MHDHRGEVLNIITSGSDSILVKGAATLYLRKNTFLAECKPHLNPEAAWITQWCRFAESDPDTVKSDDHYVFRCFSRSEPSGPTTTTGRAADVVLLGQVESTKIDVDALCRPAWIVRQRTVNARHCRRSDFLRNAMASLLDNLYPGRASDCAARLYCVGAQDQSRVSICKPRIHGWLAGEQHGRRAPAASEQPASATLPDIVDWFAGKRSENCKARWCASSSLICVHSRSFAASNMRLVQVTPASALCNSELSTLRTRKPELSSNSQVRVGKPRAIGISRRSAGHLQARGIGRIVQDFSDCTARPGSIQARLASTVSSPM